MHLTIILWPRPWCWPGSGPRAPALHHLTSGRPSKASSLCPPVSEMGATARVLPRSRRHCGKQPGEMEKDVINHHALCRRFPKLFRGPVAPPGGAQQSVSARPPAGPTRASGRASPDANVKGEVLDHVFLRSPGVLRGVRSVVGAERLVFRVPKRKKKSLIG